MPREYGSTGFVVQVSQVCFLAQRVVPDGPCIVHDLRHTCLVELAHLLGTQMVDSTEGDGCFGCPFDSLNVLLPPQLPVKQHSQQLRRG
jgi:hypothetical protein